MIIAWYFPFASILRSIKLPYFLSIFFDKYVIQNQYSWVDLARPSRETNSYALICVSFYLSQICLAFDKSWTLSFSILNMNKLHVKGQLIWINPCIFYHYFQHMIVISLFHISILDLILIWMSFASLEPNYINQSRTKHLHMISSNLVVP